MKHVKGERTPTNKSLSVTHRALLGACLHLGTDDTQELARFLHLAPVTIKTYFARILKILNKSTRTEVILWYALREGLLLQAGGTPPPAPIGQKGGTVEKCLPKETTPFNRFDPFMVYRILVGAKETPTSNATVKQGKERLRNVDEEERRIFIDQVAQAVIDRMEQRDQIVGIADLVTLKVIELQKQSAELKAAAEAENNAPTTEPGNEEAA